MLNFRPIFVLLKSVGIFNVAFDLSEYISLCFFTGLQLVFKKEMTPKYQVSKRKPKNDMEQIHWSEKIPQRPHGKLQACLSETKNQPKF